MHHIPRFQTSDGGSPTLRSRPLMNHRGGGHTSAIRRNALPSGSFGSVGDLKVYPRRLNYICSDLDARVSPSLFTLISRGTTHPTGAEVAKLYQAIQGIKKWAYKGERGPSISINGCSPVLVPSHCSLGGLHILHTVILDKKCLPFRPWWVLSPIWRRQFLHMVRLFRYELFSISHPVAATQLAVQLVTAQFKGAGIVPVRISSLMLPIGLTLGSLAPK